MHVSSLHSQKLKSIKYVSNAGYQTTYTSDRCYVLSVFPVYLLLHVVSVNLKTCTTKTQYPEKL